MRQTTKRNGKNVIPMLMAVCGINLPYWRIDRADDLHSYLSGDAADKLAAYEDAEDQGRLVVLPCKIGTPVWSSVMCRFDENGEEQPMQWPFMLSMMDEWGTGYFLTYDEAEAAMKGGQDDGTA